MVASDLSVVPHRLKREDSCRTKHDSYFSKWEILVGPSDWEDFSLGKEGAARYRLHNLPKSSGPGVYELGIAVSHTGLGREVNKLDRDRIVVVYLGQADNVRTRLQHYGRTGAHLGNSYPNAYPNDSKSVSLQKGPQLFEETSKRGYPIVFRWAPMHSKRDAEETETRLLNRFNYAWNTSKNGVRRPNDILQKVNEIASSTTRFPNIVRKLLPFSQKQVGIRIKASKLPSAGNKQSSYADEESYNFLPRIFKFGRSQPRLVLDRSVVIEENTSFCGVALGDGSFCRRPPVERRKRCAEHKEMKVNGSIPKLVTEGKSGSILGSDSRTSGDRESYGNSAQDFSNDTVEVPQVIVKHSAIESSGPICGVFLNDGSPCRTRPAHGRKRCDEHKGERIHGFITESAIGGRSQSVHSHDVSKGYNTICGVDFGYGLYCSRQPVEGRVRCEKHKGMRVDGLVSKLSTEDKSHISTSYSDYNYCNTPACGATLYDGSLCKRKPTEGNKRCWQHKGMRAGSSFSGFDSGTSLLTCGITLQNGSVCMMTPARGRKRCERHKGMRL